MGQDRYSRSALALSTQMSLPLFPTSKLTLGQSALGSFLASKIDILPQPPLEGNLPTRLLQT